jgi:hypothetical protein
MTNRLEVIDAFVDGERVDPAALKQALAEADGRDYFVDAWLLREGVHDDLRADAAAPAPPQRRPSPRLWLLAVAASIVCLVAGFLAGQRIATRATAAIAGDARAAATPPAAAASFPIPAPTRAITVEFSPDEASRGGN